VTPRFATPADAWHRLTYRKSPLVAHVIGVTPRQVERQASEHDHQNGPLDLVTMAMEAVLSDTGDVARSLAPLHFLQQRFSEAAAGHPSGSADAVHECVAVSAKDFSCCIGHILDAVKDGRVTREEGIRIKAAISAHRADIDRLEAELDAARFATKERIS
jgi:hypothetical protein